MEIWKQIKNYEGIYEISNLGRVKSLVRNTTGTNTSKVNYLKPHYTKNGYLRYVLSKNGKTKKKTMHRLIAEYFIENPLNKKCVNHKNGIRDDNTIENLEWSTHSENSIHGFRKNKRKNVNRKLTEIQVIEIKNKLINSKRGIGVKLAEEYNVSVYIISLIKKGKTYNEYNLG
jgi:hypothetical protein